LARTVGIFGGCEDASKRYCMGHILVSEGPFSGMRLAAGTYVVSDIYEDSIGASFPTPLLYAATGIEDVGAV
jgi:hypothetical protein